MKKILLFILLYASLCTDVGAQTLREGHLKYKDLDPNRPYYQMITQREQEVQVVSATIIKEEPVEEEESIAVTASAVPFSAPVGTKEEPMQSFVRPPAAEVVKKGQEGQVTTIFGTGVQGQNEYQMNHPAYLQVDKKNNIYFIDGDRQNQKLRMFDGKKLSTVAELSRSKINRTGEFWTTGVALINNQLYVSSTEEIYYVEDGRIHKALGDFEQYKRDWRLGELWRMKRQGDKIYLMIALKGRAHTFHFAEYHYKTGEFTTIIDRSDYYKPFSFYIQDQWVVVSCHLGDIVAESLFPREKFYVYKSGDSEDIITEVWLTKEEEVMFAGHNRNEAFIYFLPDHSPLEKIAGARRGYQDGFRDEVEMDNPMDFVWDGSGYLFVDPGNHVIRKLWTTRKPGVEL